MSQSNSQGLRICSGLGRDVWFDQAGEPLWGARDEAELVEFERFARALHVPLQRTDGLSSAGPRSRPTRPGLVVGYALVDEAISHVYAALTSRRYVNVYTLDELLGLQAVAVVLLRAGSLTVPLLEGLYTRETDTAPGLIFASDETALLRSCKRWAMGALALPPSPFAHAHVSAFVPPSGTASPMATRELLARGADCLALEGHPDGIHMYLPGESMLCPIQPGKRPEGGLAPYCTESQSCPRYPHRPALEDAWRDKPLIDPAELKARVVYNGTCFAFHVENGVVDPAYSLACAIAERSSTLAMVGSWKTTLADPGVPDWLFGQLAQGRSIGEVVAGFNALELERRNGVRLALLGDPAYRAPRPDIGSNAAAPSLASPTVYEGRQTQLRPGAARFIELCIRNGLETHFFCDEEAAEEVLAGLDSAQEAVLQGMPTSSRFQRSLLRFFASFPRPEDAWGAASNVTRVLSDTESCPVCGSPALLYQLRFRVGVQRRALACPRCDEVVNTSRAESPHLVLKGVEAGVLGLEGMGPQTSAHVSLMPRYLPESVHLEWPVDENGLLMPEFAIPLSRLPQGQTVCRVTYAHDLEFGALSFKLRRDSEGCLRHSASISHGEGATNV